MTQQEISHGAILLLLSIQEILRGTIFVDSTSYDEFAPGNNLRREKDKYFGISINARTKIP